VPALTAVIFCQGSIEVITVTAFNPCGLARPRLFQKTPCGGVGANLFAQLRFSFLMDPDDLVKKNRLLYLQTFVLILLVKLAEK
jgi:hypothetical protein